MRKGGISDVICGDCGEANKLGTEFCLFCGAYLGWQEQEPTGANDVTQVLQAQPPAPARSSTKTPQAPASQATPSVAPVLAQPEQPAPRPESAARSEPVRPAPQPPPVTVVTAPVPPPAPSGCPSCGREIDPARRFCGHCGEQFVWPGTSAPVTRSTKRSTWWTRLWDSKDRVARRAYRRSLPPMYRWRRVIIVILALGLVVGGLSVVGPSPKSFVMARYYDVRKDLVDLTGVTAEIIPPEATVPDTTPAALTDLTPMAWQMNWTPTTNGSPCGEPPRTAVIQLSFTRTRIKEINLRAGLQKSNPNRELQFRPTKIWIAFANSCESKDLKDLEEQLIVLDTRVPVDSLRIGVVTAIGPEQPAGMQPVLSITEITLSSRPPVTGAR